MFCLLLHPPLWGKGKCSDMADFGQVCLYETGLGFLNKMHSSELQWEKARRNKCTEPLEWQAEIFVKCGWVVLTFLTLSWGNGWSYWDFLVWERKAELRAKGRCAHCWIAGSGVRPGWIPASSPGMSLGTQEHPWPRQGMSRRVTFGNCGVRALDLDSHLFTGCPKWDVSGWEMANTTLFWDCWSLCSPSAGSGLRSWTSSVLLTVVISLQNLCIYYQCCCSKTDWFWVGI